MPPRNAPKQQNKSKGKGDNQGSANAASGDDDFILDMVNAIDDEEGGDNLKRLAKQMSQILLPALTKAVTVAIEKFGVDKQSFEKAKSNILTSKFDNDKLEQYTRRENIRIGNFATPDGDDLMASVLVLLNDIFLEESKDNPPCKLSAADISVVHRIGKKPADGSTDKRQIIVRFISRQHVMKVYQYKKNLKSMATYKDKGVYITDDITQLRLKLKNFLKQQEGITKVYTIDGNIHCEKDQKHYVVSSPDDLFFLDIDVDLDVLGLKNYK